MSYPMRVQLLLIALIVTGSFCEVSGQGNAERARAIERADLDRILLWAVPKDRESEAMRQSRVKNIKDDIRDIQNFNNKMMALAGSQ